MRVSLVIAGRNAEATVAACLDAVVAELGRDGLEEIIFVDDGSTDRTAEIAAGYPVRLLSGERQGAAAARNLGWQHTDSPLVWFIDADCVAERGALKRLLPHLSDPSVAGVGGSYANRQSDSLLAALVHEEIIARHRRMPVEVNFLASYHVVYRRRVLEELRGFDRTCIWAHDAELAFRVREAGHRLRFEIGSRVAHFHPTRLSRYLAKQWQQGYWRVMLYRRHPARMAGDSYSGWCDFVQPPLAVLSLLALPLMAVPPVAWLAPLLVGALLLVQLPMTVAMVRQSRQWRYAAFAALGFIRAFWRGGGMTAALLSTVRGR